MNLLCLWWIYDELSESQKRSLCDIILPFDINRGRCERGAGRWVTVDIKQHPPLLTSLRLRNVVLLPRSCSLNLFPGSSRGGHWISYNPPRTLSGGLKDKSQFFVIWKWKQWKPEKRCKSVKMYQKVSWFLFWQNASIPCPWTQRRSYYYFEKKSSKYTLSSFMTVIKGWEIILTHNLDWEQSYIIFNIYHNGSACLINLCIDVECNYCNGINTHK